MRNPFALIDSAIERRIIIPVSQRYEQLTGRTNFHLCAMFTGAQLALLFLSDVPPVSDSTNWELLAVNTLMNLPACAWIMYDADKQEKKSLRAEMCGQTASERLVWVSPVDKVSKVFWTVLFLSQALTFLGFWHISLQGIANIVTAFAALGGIYFGSITKPPKLPKKQPKLTGWFNLVPVSMRGN